MTIADAAHILNLQPNRGSVHRRIRQLLEAGGETAGTLMQDGILTPQAERAVRQATEARGERQPEATVYSEATRKTLGSYSEPSPVVAEAPSVAAAYARLQAEHEVLRQELERVTQYLDDCDRLLGEMCRTINALEERQYRMEQEKSQERRTGPLEALVRMPQVFYSNVLRRQTG